MNRRRPVWMGAMLALALGALSACSPHVATLSGRGSLRITGQEVRISVSDAPTAYVQSGGGLVIGARTVPLTPGEQTLARLYYHYAIGVRAAGEATGKAGGRLGVAIVGSLFSALWHDNSSVINRTAHAGAATVTASARKLCAQLAGLESVQNTLAAAQPAFAPYRVIRHRDVSHCFTGTAKHGAHTS